jgi:hypothetical protein
VHAWAGFESPLKDPIKEAGDGKSKNFAALVLDRG